MSGMDLEKLGQCFESYGAGLALYGRQWLDPSDAEDVVQEAFIKLMRQNIAPDNVKAWLYCLVRNEAINRLRQRQRHQNRANDVAFMQAGWFERESGNPLDADAAEKALSGLADDLREVVVLKIWGEMTLKEMGVVLSQPVSTVFHKYQTAMQALRKKMEESCRKNTN
jgi:RNA polymerase sigma-70 factor (ECF subfamily)